MDGPKLKRRYEGKSQIKLIIAFIDYRDDQPSTPED